MARFLRRSSFLATSAALLIAAGCSTVSVAPPTGDSAPSSPPTPGPGPAINDSNATKFAFVPLDGEIGWTARAELPAIVNARLLVTLEAELKSARPGEEIEMVVTASPATPLPVARTTALVLDAKTTQRFFVGGVTNLPAGTFTLRIRPGNEQNINLAIHRCELRAVPTVATASFDEQRNYSGQSPRAAWRTAAAARIEELRKAPARIIVRDAAGKPMRSAMVELTLQQPALRIAAQSPSPPGAPLPRGRLVNTWLAPVNSSWGSAQVPEASAATLLEGGVLLPLSTARNQPLENTALSTGERLTALKNRISDVLTPFAQADMNWDLSDGLARHIESLEALAPDVLAQLLATARKAAPKAKVFLHDFSILEGGARKLDDFMQKAVELQGSGVRFDGLSVTLEAYRSAPPPAEVIARLDRLAAANLPLRIAPLGIVGDFAPDTARAAAGDLLLAVFSQPAVQSLIIARADQAPWDEVLRNPPGLLKEWIPGMKYKSRTDAEGRVLLRVPAGHYAVSVSAPRGLQRSEIAVTQGVGGSIEVGVPSAPAQKPVVAPVP